MSTIISDGPACTGVVIDGLSWCVILCGVSAGPCYRRDTGMFLR